MLCGILFGSWRYQRGFDALFDVCDMVDYVQIKLVIDGDMAPRIVDTVLVLKRILFMP
jgi:hypothetical protein